MADVSVADVCSAAAVVAPAARLKLELSSFCGACSVGETSLLMRCLLHDGNGTVALLDDDSQRYNVAVQPLIEEQPIVTPVKDESFRDDSAVAAVAVRNAGIENAERPSTPVTADEPVNQPGFHPLTGVQKLDEGNDTTAEANNPIQKPTISSASEMVVSDGSSSLAYEQSIINTTSRQEPLQLKSVRPAAKRSYAPYYRRSMMHRKEAAARRRRLEPNHVELLRCLNAKATSATSQLEKPQPQRTVLNLSCGDVGRFKDRRQLPIMMRISAPPIKQTRTNNPTFQQTTAVGDSFVYAAANYDSIMHVFNKGRLDDVVMMKKHCLHLITTRSVSGERPISKEQLEDHLNRNNSRLTESEKFWTPNGLYSHREPSKIEEPNIRTTVLELIRQELRLPEILVIRRNFLERKEVELLGWFQERLIGSCSSEEGTSKNDQSGICKKTSGQQQTDRPKALPNFYISVANRTVKRNNVERNFSGPREKSGVRHGARKHSQWRGFNCPLSSKLPDREPSKNNFRPRRRDNPRRDFVPSRTAHSVRSRTVPQRPVQHDFRQEEVRVRRRQCGQREQAPPQHSYHQHYGRLQFWNEPNLSWYGNLPPQPPYGRNY